MTNRYDLLITSIHQTNATVQIFFAFATAMVAGYYVLAWLPVWLIRPARWAYIVALLLISVLTTVFFARG